MACLSCSSLNIRINPAEINIHHPGMEGLSKPTVWAFPCLSICMDCGLTQFTLTLDQLCELTESNNRKEAAAA